MYVPVYVCVCVPVCVYVPLLPPPDRRLYCATEQQNPPPHTPTWPLTLVCTKVILAVLTPN